MNRLGAFSEAVPPANYPGLSIDLGLPQQLEPYEMPPEAKAALDVAMLLGRPLLVTGAPGVGKTRLGWEVARCMGLRRGYHFVTRSTSEARDLFYSYDALRRFRDAHHNPEQRDPRPYITYQALGAAILDGSEQQVLEEFAGAGVWPRDDQVRQSVVVIDEIDKASRDFANDVLVEVENMSFRVPELSQTPIARPPHDRCPIVIVTSNSERDLSDAFLRRCVFLHLNYPDQEMLTRILSSHAARVSGGTSSPESDRRVGMVVKLVQALQADEAMRKRPGTAEAVDAVKVMVAAGRDGQMTPLDSALGLAALTLAKTREDVGLFAAKVQNMFAIALPPQGDALR